MTDHATAAIAALSAAFRRRDLEAAVACFADDPGTTYAGSEQGEVAVGPDAVRELLGRIFERDESYSWETLQVWSSLHGGLLMVMAELAGTVHLSSGGADCFPYRLSGVLHIENDESRWLLCHGTVPEQSA
jgi:ketosteroid isomerase-like protein